MPLPSVLEKLQAAAPAAEIWWDSSPLVYPAFKESTLALAPDAQTRTRWAAQLDRFLDTAHPTGSLVRGVTTNPSLMAKSIIEAPETWAPEVREAHLRQARPDVRETYWIIYQEALRRAAQVMLPLWRATNGKYGWVSGQLDPRCIFDADAMLEQGLQLARIAPNLMVKVPGTRQGYETIRRLVSRGISVNNTLSYSVPQFTACIRAVEAGLAEARRQGVDTSRWRTVITHMIGRFGTQGDLLDEAAARGMSLSPREIRLAEIAILKRIQRTIVANGHPVTMLLSSLETDAPETGALSMHLEETAGAAIAYTCKPSFVADLMRREAECGELDPGAIDREVPAETLRKLQRLPYFAKAYDPDGMPPEDFANYGAFITTYAEVARNARRLVDFVAQHAMAPEAAEAGEPVLDPAYATAAE
ncbi:transaldolase family protein [Salinarimonas ramus]|uniref:Transaldolase n=1 Tax=Salinarimonas ramus TaxID=690164 RepID=A0A917QGM3_9HYPH|nr:transaldolase family protein [Salinarimonas ramus]GGK49512.1 hypothetical protein GCM10011322_40670 [Salinarimonas ramus]